MQIVQKVQSKFLHVSFVRSVSFNKNLHGDIDDIGDIANFATFANAFFLNEKFCFLGQIIFDISIVLYTKYIIQNAQNFSYSLDIC